MLVEILGGALLGSVIANNKKEKTEKVIITNGEKKLSRYAVVCVNGNEGNLDYKTIFLTSSYNEAVNYVNKCAQSTKVLTGIIGVKGNQNLSAEIVDIENTLSQVPYGKVVLLIERVGDISTSTPVATYVVVIY